MLTLIFKLADLAHYTGARPAQLQHWIVSGLLLPDVKDARSSGDHRQFSLQNLIEAAQLVEMTRVHLTQPHMRLRLSAQRAQLDKLPASARASCAWTHYVHQVMADAELLGETADPQYQAWARDVAREHRQLQKHAETPLSDTQILEWLCAERAARSPQRGGRGESSRTGPARARA